MPSATTIRICDPFGNFLVETAEFLDAGNNPGLRYALNCGAVGAMTVTLPPSYNPLLLKDGRIHIMRSVNGGPAAREGGSCFLIRRWDYAPDHTTITAVHANDLIRRRAILYAPVLGNSLLAGQADNEIKRLWNENSGGAIGTFRAYSTVTATADPTQADLSAWVSIQGDMSIAPAVTGYVAWRNMLEVFQEVADFSAQNGTWLTAEIVSLSEAQLQIQTFTRQRGADQRFSTGSGLLFSPTRGNLENALLTINAIEEITVGQALGAAIVSNRYTGYAADYARMAESPFGRIEAIVDSGDAPNDATLTDDSSTIVRAGRPTIHAIADLVETDQCIRGVHYNFGDYLTVEVQGIQYDMRLNIMDVALTASGERTTARFEYNNA